MAYFASKDRYDQMKYNRCGNSGLLLPAVSLGLWHNFGGGDDYQKMKDILLRAFDMGITHFDLANNYGPPPGSAESNLKNLMHGELAQHRDELIISTKAGYLMWDGPYGEWGSRKYLMASLDQSLKRMGLEYVDIFYSHRPDPDTPLEETMMALHSAVLQGKALYVGISNYDAEQTNRAVDILESLGTPCVIHQPRYNMFDRWVEDGLLEVLEERGVGCIPFSPLAQGLLTNRYLDGIPKGSRIDSESIFLGKDNLDPETMVKVKALNQHAEQRGQSLAQMALAWILEKKQITSVLIGASSVAQLEANVATVNNLKFTRDELAYIENILV
ncbi:MAG: L-glyceraldehyde 3-phosphate reductase [Bacteroidetes bacterium]|nr:MAG: L-glyceraldehyde 3-phosphate reductase [Bacteroidota bacterium]RLD92290.1 MAG: L-glyceraldehyde 3-phosphate reductase [Bacteroidota bacterium]RLD98314.1 MAG: L-glyceraldehyde 3-phosphate reductase [Bacteroidota bacterium]